MRESSVPSLITWEHYLVYAISLGTARDTIEKLKLVIPPEQFNNKNLTYFNSDSGLFADNSFMSFQNFINDISVSAIISSKSSSLNQDSGNDDGEF